MAIASLSYLTAKKDISGNGQDRPFDKKPDNAATFITTDWSRDGRYIIETAPSPKTGTDIWLQPLFGERKLIPYVHTEANERLGKVSPNGKWLAYMSDETKRNEVYVQTFPNPGGKWQVSVNGGGKPVWSRDGKELFFISSDQKMMAVEVKDSGKFEAGTPRALFNTSLSFTSTSGFFDVSKDGRFLMPIAMEQSANAPMTVVINWQAGLKK